MSEIEYDLVLSRVFAGSPSDVRAAFTDDACLGAWAGPKNIRWSAAAVEGSAQLDGAGPLVGQPAEGAPAGRMELEFGAEPEGRTRLRLRQGPLTDLGQTAAQAWWNSAFCRLDRLLTRARNRRQ